MNKRYLCTRHEEATPSVVVYPDHGWCFGCCQKIPLAELGVSPQEAIREASYIEDIKATLNYIANLPKKEIRSFNLPFNDRGYYLVFPTLDYYKFRSADGESKSKYRGPSGHQKPWFPAQIKGHKTLVLIEGEFNALSYSTLEPEADIISPGGAGDFYSRLGKKYLDNLLHYDNYLVIVDDDAAGLQAAIETKAYLCSRGKKEVRIVLVKEDFNDVHCKKGKETKEAFEAYIRELGLPTGVRRV